MDYKVKTVNLYVYELIVSVHDKNWDYEYENLISIHTTSKEASERKRQFILLNKRNNRIFNCKLIKQVWIDRRKVDEKCNFWLEGFLSD